MNPIDKDFLIAIADGTADPQEHLRYDKLCEEDKRIELYIHYLRATRERLRRAAQAEEISCPAELRRRILEQVRQAPTPRLSIARWWWAAAAAAVVVVLILQPWHSRSVNFRDESLSNFELIIAGKLAVMKSTSDFNELVSFFRSQGVQYPIINIPIKAQLVGGVISEHEGTKLAHLIYRRDSTLIYMYQAPEELFHRGILTLPKQIKPYLYSGRWYAENVNSHSWLFWRVQSVCCTVVANAPKDLVSLYFVEATL